MFKEKDVSLVVLAIFGFAFLYFMLNYQVPYTSYATLESSDIEAFNITTGGVPNVTIHLQFYAGDSIPGNSSIEAKIFNESNDLVEEHAENLSSFVSVTQNCVFNDTSHNPDFSWEGQQGSCYNVSEDTVVNITLEDIGFSAIETAGEYIVKVNFTYGNDQLGYGEASFNVSEAPQPEQGEKPYFINATFVNANGSSVFAVDQYVNCSVIVKDLDSGAVNVSYLINASSYEYEGYMSCNTSTDLSEEGWYCNVSRQITESYVGDWNCIIAANDSANVNLTVLTMEMINSAPYLEDDVPNFTMFKNDNRTVDFDVYFEDPDGDHLNYSIFGNETIDVEINNENGKITFFSGDSAVVEEMYVIATDEYGAEARSNNFTFNVTEIPSCQPNWSCSPWGPCINGTQNRTCIDLNNCSTSEGMPDLNRTCTPEPTCEGGDLCQLDCPNGDPDCSCEVQNGIVCSATEICNGTEIQYNGSGVCCLGVCQPEGATYGGQQQDQVEEETGGSRILIGTSIILGVILVLVIILLVNKFIKKPVLPEKKPSQVKETYIPKTKPPAEVKLAERPPEKQGIRPANLDKLQEYVRKAFEAGYSISKLKEDLLKAGWKQVYVEEAINIERLRRYIEHKLHEGVSKEEIIQSLKLKGWTAEQINKAFKYVKFKPLF